MGSVCSSGRAFSCYASGKLGPRSVESRSSDRPEGDLYLGQQIPHAHPLIIHQTLSRTKADQVPVII